MNRTRVAILGMLLDAPSSGYDLKKAFDHRVRHFWAESPGQIYPALRALESEGLVRGREADRNGRTRIVYAITRDGRRVLRDWLTEEPARAVVRNEVLLKVFFGAATEPEVLLGHVERLRAAELAQREAYAGYEHEIEETAPSDEHAALWKLALSSGRHVTEARLAWFDEAKRVLRALQRSRAS